ncbi:beta-galactosidase [Demequina pelophila]|uniref:beta-galactosidase n=1 Tax=Demequina pelophila TaxID=1638984 RepID=UPI0007862DB1|nr:beta-galactosidase [Demequina pelophila]
MPPSPHENTAPRVIFGGDYNPEQWPRETWDEDVRLMVEAGVNLVTVGVFSWATLEPSPGERNFAWLDEILDLLHANGIDVDLATPCASPPPWLGIEHPEILPVDQNGVRLVAGSRNQFTPASRVYRERSLAIARDLAERYVDHPAVVMWHVGNEYGQLDYGDEAAREFRAWLTRRYGTIEALNAAWGTAVWSQGYRSFEEVLPPRAMPYLVNPTQNLDFRRYSSDQMLACYDEQREAIRAVGATQPITTNFMGFFPHVDYWTWADHVDVVADDQYPDHSDANSPADTALVQDLMRSLGGGRPWMLMEQAISSTSWREHNLPKGPARGRLDSIQAVARGADGICFFQWRQSPFGAERHHSALLPHAGEDTEVFRTVCRLGADMKALAPVVGSRIDARVAVLFDWPSWWAAEEPGRPTARMATLEQLNRWYRSLWSRGIPADVVRPGASLEGYDAVLVPHSYILESDAAAEITAAVRRGASLVVGPYSGVADSRGHIHQGRSPVVLTDLLGVSGEEWGGVPDEGVTLQATADWAGAPASPITASVLAERLRADDATVLARFSSGDLTGMPALTRRAEGEGTAWYLGAVVDDAALDTVLAEALAAADVTGPVADLPAGVEAVRRGDVLFLLNHGAPATVTLDQGGRDLLTGADLGPVLSLDSGDVVALDRRG